MKLCKSIPKISMKTIKNNCGYFKENNFVPRMPEIPLTKFLPDDNLFQVQPYPECQKNQRKLKTKSRSKTIDDLSLWYNAHLSKMQFIKTYKSVLKEKANENFGNVSFQDYSYKLSKHKGPSAQYMHGWKINEPHIDFQNYVDSVKSRQNEKYIPAESQDWKKYFEHTIPRWHDKKEIHREMLALKDKYYEKIDGFRNSNVDTNLIKNEVLTRIIKEKMKPEALPTGIIPLEPQTIQPEKYALTEYGFQLPGKLSKKGLQTLVPQIKEERNSLPTFEPHITHSGEVVVQTIVPPKKTPTKRMTLQRLDLYGSPRPSTGSNIEGQTMPTTATPYAPEKQVKNYLLNSPFIPYERMGTIANEILFDNVYDKYVPKSHFVQPKEVVKVKDKSKEPKGPTKDSKRRSKQKKNFKNNYPLHSSPPIPLLSGKVAMTPSYLLLTNDAQTFKKGNLRKLRSKMLVVGKKKRKNASCDESLCDLTNRNKIPKSDGKILVVDPSSRKRKRDNGMEKISITSEERIHSSLVNSIYNALRNSKGSPRPSFRRH